MKQPGRGCVYPVFDWHGAGVDPEVSRHIPLVYFLARKHWKPWMDFYELVSAGMLGLAQWSKQTKYIPSVFIRRRIIDVVRRRHRRSMVKAEWLGQRAPLPHHPQQIRLVCGVYI